MFKLGKCAEKNWIKLRGFDYLAKVITGIQFKDGIEVQTENRSAAWSTTHTPNLTITTSKNGAQENITIDLINNQLEKYDRLSDEIRNLANKLLDYGKLIKPARNKRIANNDRKYQIRSTTLGATTERQLFGFLDNIQLYCDAVGKSIGAGPLDFTSSGCPGDVLDFLNYLRRDDD